MLIPIKSSDFIRRGLAVTAGLAMMLGGGAAMQAQSTVSAPAVNFKAYTTPNLALNADADGVSSSSSSSATSSSADYIASVTSVNPLHLNAMQYGRRRYGRPRYRGGNTNADGSNKWMGFGAGGFTQPTGDTWHYFTPSYGIQAGFGRQFSYKFAVPIQFDYDNFGLTKQTLDNQFNLYNNQINYYCGQSQNAATCTTDGITPYTSLDGNAHVWSFSLDPTYTFFHAGGDGMGAYVVAGAGYYHKVTNFTTPGLEYYYDPYYGLEEYEANQIVDHYTSNAPGFNAGFGFTYKVSHFSNVKLYAEARYVIILNSQRTGVNVNSPVNSTTINEPDDFAPNSNRTTYVPVKFGIRF